MYVCMYVIVMYGPSLTDDTICPPKSLLKHENTNLFAWKMSKPQKKMHYKRKQSVEINMFVRLAEFRSRICHHYNTHDSVS